jgi:ABC-type dipeptide/oligopeptide/nickel transport system ATPase component
MLLEIRDLVVELPRRDHVYQVLNGVDLDLRDGETLGLVGESGCGKTMLCRAILGLLPQPGARIRRGHIRLRNEDLLCLSSQEMAKLRGSKIGFIPQEPASSLNPVLSVGDQIAESLRRHRGLSGGQLISTAEALLARMHIPAPRERLGSFPHELSGGMCQRVLSAIALSGEPLLLLADEPTTALDATIQLQFLLLLREIQMVSGCGILFVTHDFGIVGQLCDRVSVMYAGRVVECAPVQTLLKHPRHPYAEALVLLR